jgi:hypothetical protein
MVDVVEGAWLNWLQIKSSICSSPKVRPRWQLHIPSTEFKKWLELQDHHTLCFDGASKGNLGVAGARGVSYGSRGELELSFAWGLGLATNNQAEQYALFLGLSLAQERGILQLSLLGDSLNTIRILHSTSLQRNA